MYDGRKHTCVEGNHIVNVFSFSKAYGMMGWRVGYVSSAYYFLRHDNQEEIKVFSLEAKCLILHLKLELALIK